MYCLEGYETLATAYARCHALAQRWAQQQSAIEGPVHFDPILKTFRDEEYRRDAYVEWLWIRFAIKTYNGLYCCSENGVLLKLDSRSGQLWNRIDPDTQFPEDIDGLKNLADQNGDVFIWIESYSFTIRVQTEDMPTDAWDLGGYMNSTMTPLVGRPVCWKPPKESMTLSDFREFLQEANAEAREAELLERVRRGRPPLPSRPASEVLLSVFSEMREDYRNQKHDVLIAEATAWAKKHLGVSPGRSTVQNWLAPLIEDLARK